MFFLESLIAFQTFLLLFEPEKMRGTNWCWVKYSVYHGSTHGPPKIKIVANEGLGGDSRT